MKAWQILRIEDGPILCHWCGQELEIGQEYWSIDTETLGQLSYCTPACIVSARRAREAECQMDKCYED